MTDLSEPVGSSRRISWGARVIAPLALVLALVAVVLVVTGSMSIDDNDSPDEAATTSQEGAHDGANDGAETPKTYTVEEGDLLSTIAEKFGVSVERLERLNPDIDPQTLATGTEIKIR